jgi:hypothetical protein
MKLHYSDFLKELSTLSLSGKLQLFNKTEFDLVLALKKNKKHFGSHIYRRALQDKCKRHLRWLKSIAKLYIDQALEEQQWILEPEYKKSSKDKYRYLCRFNIQSNILPFIKGYDLLCKFGLYCKEYNPHGVVKDHRYSVAAGFKNHVSPDILKHLANLEFLLVADNIKKSDTCSVSLEQLLQEIQIWGAYTSTAQHQ